MAKCKGFNIPGDTLIYTFDDDWFLGVAYRRAATEAFPITHGSLPYEIIRRNKHDIPAHPDPETTENFRKCVRCCLGLPDEKKREFYDDKVKRGLRCGWLDDCIRRCLAFVRDYGIVPCWCPSGITVIPKEVVVEKGEEVVFDVLGCSEGKLEVSTGAGVVTHVTDCVNHSGAFSVRCSSVPGVYSGSVVDGGGCRGSFKIEIRDVELEFLFDVTTSMPRSCPGNSVCVDVHYPPLKGAGPGKLFYKFGPVDGDNAWMNEQWFLVDKGECVGPLVVNWKTMPNVEERRYSWTDCFGNEGRYYWVGAFFGKVYRRKEK